MNFPHELAIGIQNMMPVPRSDNTFHGKECEVSGHLAVVKCSVLVGLSFWMHHQITFPATWQTPRQVCHSAVSET